MKGITHFAGTVLMAGALVWTSAAMAGCNGQHRDRRTAVYQALNQHHMNSVEVFEDQGSGVITLKGIVGSANNKTQAEQVVQQAAPGYRVNNQLTVDSAGIMSMAKPNAQAPELQQMAHAPGGADNPAAPARPQHQRR